MTAVDNAHTANNAVAGFIAASFAASQHTKSSAGRMADLSCRHAVITTKYHAMQQERSFSNIACDLDVTSLKKTNLKTNLTSSGRHLSMIRSEQNAVQKAEVHLEMSTVCWVSPSLAWCMISTKT